MAWGLISAWSSWSQLTQGFKYTKKAEIQHIDTSKRTSYFDVLFSKKPKILIFTCHIWNMIWAIKKNSFASERKIFATPTA
jgi:hypothetical protein